MDLWKKIVQLGQKVMGKEIANPHQLDNKLLEKLSAYLQPVSEYDAELGFGLMKYVVDDGDESILLRLRGEEKARDKLGFSQNYYQHNQEIDRARHAVLQDAPKAPPEVWIRYAKLIESARFGTHHAALYNTTGLPSWLFTFMCELEDSHNVTIRNSQPLAPWSINEIEKILVASELPADSLIAPFLNRNSRGFRTSYYYGQAQQILYLDLPEYCGRHSTTLRTVYNGFNTEQRSMAIEVLGAIDFDFAQVEDLLIQAATGSSKTVRESALKTINNNPEKYKDALASILTSGSAAERNETVQLMWRLYGTACSDTLREHLAREKADRVKQTIEKYLAAPLEDSEVDSVLAESVAPVGVDLSASPLPDGVKEEIRKCFADAYQRQMEAYEGQLHQWNSGNRPGWMTQPVKPQSLSDKEIDHIVGFIDGTVEKNELRHEAAVRSLYMNVKKDLHEVLNPPEVKLVHIVRLMYTFHAVQLQTYSTHPTVYFRDKSILDNYRPKCNPPVGLRELDVAFATLPNYPADVIGRTYMTQTQYWNAFADFEDQEVWPLFAEKREYIREVLSPSTKGSLQSYDYYMGEKRKNAFKVLAMFPKMPGEFVTLLWDLALGETKTDRRQAQDALNTVPDKVDKVIVALADGRQAVRSAAAEWLGRLGDKSAIEPLKKAFSKEKNEIAKGTIMHALDALGADVDEFLNRDQLLKDAKAGLEKKRPKGMEWVDLENLPTMQWADSGKEVDPAIMQWWIVQSIQQKTPICGPILKRYLQMCNPIDARKFAKHVLSSWIARDTATISSEEAMAKAQADADKQWQNYGTSEWFIEAYKGNKENLVKAIYQNLMNECLYSAIEQKGMLAIVSAAGDGDCVKMSEQFIRKWYGNRLAQCKSLVDVLAWLDHPLALQTLLAIANRFRTKAIKQLAEEHVQAVADRQGWTIDELSDRTIPDGGFERPVDENGEPIGHEAILEIDFGPRQFQVRLDDKLEPVICEKGESKPLKNLPAPGKSDDEELAKLGKKSFSDAKKIAKEVVKRQSERLYEALCTQRTWQFDDWYRYLAQHPIVGRLCVRLAWVAFTPAGENTEEKFIGCFRPLEDGSLTNEKDEAVTLPDDAVIKLAHACNVSEELGKAWKQHFEDYDVKPLFQQFGRTVYVLPADKEKATDVTDFVGHLITTFKLRGKANKIGYVRGDAEDGGCFYLYRKPFGSLSIQAVIEFTGSYLPEQDLPAALKDLYFVRIANNNESQYSWGGNKIMLSKVPPVLLSECYNDMKQIAAEGSGFDPKWEEKSYF